VRVLVQSCPESAEPLPTYTAVASTPTASRVTCLRSRDRTGALLEETRFAVISKHVRPSAVFSIRPIFPAALQT
jgi:hypothetical protein